MAQKLACDCAVESLVCALARQRAMARLDSRLGRVPVVDEGFSALFDLFELG